MLKRDVYGMKISNQPDNLNNEAQQARPESGIQFVNLTPESTSEQNPEDSSPQLSENIPFEFDLDFILDLPPDSLVQSSSVFSEGKSGSDGKDILEEPHETFAKKVLYSFSKNFIQVKIFQII